MSVIYSVIYQVTEILDAAENDETRTIEQAAENLKQTIISSYYNLTNSTTINQQQERIVLTAGVIIDN